MKKTSIIKILCVIALFLSIHRCGSYKTVAPYIVLVKENTSFLNQTLTIGQPLVVEGQRGSQYYGYIYVNGEKKEGYISSRNVVAYVFDESFEKEITSFPDSYRPSRLQVGYVARRRTDEFVLRGGCELFHTHIRLFRHKIQMVQGGMAVLRDSIRGCRRFLFGNDRRCRF